MMKKVVAVIVALISVFPLFSGCGDGQSADQVIDPDKTQITFSVFNGGYGKDWAVEAAEAYNATDDKFQVIIAPNKDEWYSIRAGFEANTAMYDIYMESADYREAYAKDWFEDLTDVYNSKPDGADDRTMVEKIYAKDKDFFDKVFKHGGRYYGIPFVEGFSGFVYDHSIFLAKGFLIGQDGTPITDPSQPLSVGRDGEPGTLDDGHPINLVEYDLMLNKIKQSNLKPYLWTGKFSYYLSPLFHSLYAEYDGMDAYMLNFSFSGSYTAPGTTNTIHITPATGYEVFQMKGRKVALDFFYNYLCNPSNYHNDSLSVSTSHTDAQRTFVYGNALSGQADKQQAAFLYEGLWWENEARGNFNALVGNGYTDYQYGTRDYRMMMLPLLDSVQQDNGYKLATLGINSIYVKKQSDPLQRQAIINFLTFLHKDEWIKKFIATTGGLRPFDCPLSDSELTGLTSFSRNSYKLYTSPGVDIIRLNLNQYISDTAYFSANAGTVKFSILYTHIGNNAYSYPSNVFMRGSGIAEKGNAEQYFQNAYTYYKTNWGAVSLG